MTKFDRLVATGSLAFGAVNLILLLQTKARLEYSIEGLTFIVRILLGNPA